MKKNFFSKAVALAAIMLAGLSLNSCDEKDNAIIDGKVWVKPEVTLTDGGAIVTASSPDDISRMIGRVRQEMAAAAQTGKTFTLDIDAPVLNATSSDNTISIPTINGGDVVVNFKSAISTEVPLVLETKGVADDAVSTTSTNKVAINIPSTSDADLKINMPFTTVTLNAASGSMTIDELVAKTALNTLNIGKGVTVNWLKMTGGRALVEEGGKVLGYLRDGSEQTGYGNDADVDTLGVWPIYIGGGNYDVYYIKEEAEKPYYVQSLKIVKGEELKVARVRVENGKQADEAKVIIADGAAASFSVNGVNDATGTWYPAKVSIKGEGNKTAKIYSQSLWKNPSEDFYRGSIDLSDVNEISNVTVDATTHPDYYDASTQEYSKIDILLGYISLPKSSTDCDIFSAQNIYGSVNNSALSKITNCNLTCPIDTIKKDDDWWISSINNFKANNCKLTAIQIYSIDGNCENSAFKSNYVSFNNFYISDNSATVKNCTFETVYDRSYSSINLPYQTEKRSSFDFIFDKCQLGSNFRITTNFEGSQRIYDKDGNVATKEYSYCELENDGVTVKKDDSGNPIWKHVYNESDIPEANKKNGEWAYNDDGDMIGWYYYTNPNGFTEPAKYKNYKCYITFNNSTLGGKAITKNTEIIRNVSDAIRSRNDDEGNIATATYINIDGKNYEPAWSPNAKKWVLSEVE